MKTPEKTRCESCIIRQFNALKAFSKEELKVISDNKITKSYKKGEQIFKEGEKLNGVFCVRDGASKLSKLSENGKHQNFLDYQFSWGFATTIFEINNFSEFQNDNFRKVRKS